MALVFMDGFDHYTDRTPELAGDDPLNELWDKWEYSINVGGVGARSSLSVLRRTAPSSWNIGYLGVATSWYPIKIYRHFNEPHYDTLIVGFAFNALHAMNPPTAPEILFYDEDLNLCAEVHPIDSLGRPWVRVFKDAGAYDDYYGPNDTTEENTWYHCECKILFDDSAGTIELKINETLVIDESGIQTFKTGGDSNNNYSFAEVAIEKGIFAGMAVDDFYVLDGQGSVANDFIGDVRIDTIYPDADGDLIDFNPFPDTEDNYECVQPILFSYYRGLFPFEWWWDATAIDKDKYNEGVTVGHRECYHHESLLSLNTPVLAVQQVSMFRKTDAGQKQVEQFLRIGANNYDSGRDIDVPDFYKFYYNPVTLNPATSTQWTEATVATIQSGIKINI